MVNLNLFFESFCKFYNYQEPNIQIKEYDIFLQITNTVDDSVNYLHSHSMVDFVEALYTNLFYLMDFTTQTRFILDQQFTNKTINKDEVIFFYKYLTFQASNLWSKLELYCLDFKTKFENFYELTQLISLVEKDYDLIGILDLNPDLIFLSLGECLDYKRWYNMSDIKEIPKPIMASSFLFKDNKNNNQNINNTFQIEDTTDCSYMIGYTKFFKVSFVKTKFTAKSFLKKDAEDLILKQKNDDNINIKNSVISPVLVRVFPYEKPIESEEENLRKFENFINSFLKKPTRLNKQGKLFSVKESEQTLHYRNLLNQHNTNHTQSSEDTTNYELEFNSYSNSSDSDSSY